RAAGSPNFLAQLAQPVFPARQYPDPCPLTRELGRERPADPARRARDTDDLISEAHTSCPPPTLVCQPYRGTPTLARLFRLGAAWPFVDRASLWKGSNPAPGLPESFHAAPPGVPSLSRARAPRQSGNRPGSGEAAETARYVRRDDSLPHSRRPQ